MTIEVTIDTLVLEGIAADQAPAAGEALRRELSRLLTADAAPAGRPRGAPHAATPAGAGEAAARAIHQRIAR